MSLKIKEKPYKLTALKRKNFSYVSIPVFVSSTFSDDHILTVSNFSYSQNSQNYCVDNSDICIRQCYPPHFAVCPHNGHETNPDIDHSIYKIVTRRTVGDTSNTVLECHVHVYILYKRIRISFSLPLP